MQKSVSALVDDLRKPQYTGENRCLPCTTVNVVLAVVVGLGLSVLLTPLVGMVAFAVSLAAIYLRGYLVPGTPELTKQYFPDWVLAWFDKGPEPAPQTPLQAAESPAEAEGRTARPDADEQVDPETFLTWAEAVEPCDEVDDLCLTESFAAAWNDEIERLRDEEARRLALVDLFETDAISVDSTGVRVSVLDDGTPVGAWPSDGALVADLAADRVLVSQRDEWSDISPQQRFSILAGLRSFRETCPICDGRTEIGEETVKSCCRSWDVITVRCLDCGEELLEVNPRTLETVA